ncbi:hypothetical protein WJX73_005683 [Symbiochloris irregularis]|uniref:Enoyl reductase (ER) domain-containing protein n=1 Tax=Symbiochloris irregularis TaxID=706552 RepID=A0AAW1NX03_9CHLO
MFTRQGHSPSVRFPRVLGIEAVGVVESAPDGDFATGQIVATAMGGMGRDFDGGYAEFTCVPSKHVQVIKTQLPWETLGALPEMMQTAWGSLFIALDLQPGERLLVRGGTTSVGLAAAAIAKLHGAHVMATTRKADRADMLKQNGADEVFVDTGAIAQEVQKAGGAHKVLELIGVATLKDSLQATLPKGTVCMTGIAGNKWSFDEFSPMEAIPTAVKLTAYSGGPSEFMQTPLEQFASQIAQGKLKVHTGKAFTMDQIVAAHEAMETGSQAGRMVVLT